MLSLMFRSAMVFAFFCGYTNALADVAPEFCETHPNSCPDPGKIYRYPKFDCPNSVGLKCSVPLPLAVISCEQSAYGETYCEAWPQGANPALHYAWHTSNPDVILDAQDSPMQFLNCEVNTNTTISVTIRDAQGRSTSAAVVARCRVPGNPNNHLPL